MKKIPLLFFVAIFLVFGKLHSQCIVIDTLENLNFNNNDFVGTGGTWTVVQGGVTNTWIVNADYDYGLFPPYSTIPAQPSPYITGAPNSSYAHIACYGSSCTALNMQNDPSYLDDGSNTTELVYLESPVYSVAGSDSAKFSFWTVIAGVAISDYGYVEIKKDNGNWQALTNPILGRPTWMQQINNINTSGISNLQLRFVFKVLHDNNGNDPSFCIDEVKLIKYSTLVLDTSVSYNSATQTLTANATGVSYQWVNCDSNYAPVPGAASATFTPTVTGNYAVIVSSNSCSDTSSCHFVDITTSLNSLKKQVIHYYPSIVKEHLYLQGNFDKGRILNLLGKETMRFTGNVLNLKTLAPGIYFLEIDNRVIGKFIKE